MPTVDVEGADWHRRVVDRSLSKATQRSIDRGAGLIRAAAALLERSDGAGFTVQDVADEAGQSLRTLYQYFESKDDLLLAVFEEAMGVYARIISDAIAKLDDPLERLAGALLAAIALPARTDTGINRGLARLRLKLTEVEPELIGRSQAPVTSLLIELIDAAVAAGHLPDADRESSTFLALGSATAVITSATLGNDMGVRRPDVQTAAAYCLRGLGAVIDPAQLRSIERRLQLPRGELRLSRTPRAR